MSIMGEKASKRIAVLGLVMAALSGAAGHGQIRFHVPVVEHYDARFSGSDAVYERNGVFALSSITGPGRSDAVVIDYRSGETWRFSQTAVEGIWGDRIVARDQSDRRRRVFLLDYEDETTEDLFPEGWDEFWRSGNYEYEENIRFGYTLFDRERYELAFFNLETQEIREFHPPGYPPPVFSWIPRGVSPDGRLFLASEIRGLGGDCIVDFESGEILGVHRARRGLLLSQPEVLTPALFKTRRPDNTDESEVSFALHAYDGTPIANVFIGLPGGEPTRQIFFSRDLTRGLTRSGRLVDTTDFRDWLAERDLLFHSTAAQVTAGEQVVRRFARLDSSEQGRLVRGDEVEVLDRSAQEVAVAGVRAYWYEVERERDGLRGWTHGAALRLAEEQGPIPPVDWEPVEAEGLEWGEIPDPLDAESIRRIEDHYGRDFGSGR